MKKIVLTGIFGLFGLSGSIALKTNATPPVTWPTFRNAHTICWYTSDCQVYRYFSNAADATAFIEISVPGTYTYVGLSLVPSTYNLAWPGYEFIKCSSGTLGGL